MVEHGKAYPKNEDQYLAFSFFYKNLQALAHPALFIHKITPFKICPFLWWPFITLFFLKHNDLYNENEG